jgi:hypothetical protein
MAGTEVGKRAEKVVASGGECVSLTMDLSNFGLLFSPQLHSTQGDLIPCLMTEDNRTGQEIGAKVKMKRV